MNLFPLNQTDGYKVDHRSQYPKGCELVYSNFTPRTTRYAAKSKYCDDKVVVFGTQYFIKWFLIETFNKEFFQKPHDEVVARYQRRISGYLGPDAITYDHVSALHKLGYLPLSVRSLPEGATVNAGIPTVSIENTLPEFFWLTNFFETIMSCLLWKPSTSATTARKFKKLLDYFCSVTGGDPESVKFQGHDFSFRGMSGIQDAQMSGAGHLLYFVGTDTIPAIDFLEDYYGADSTKELIGCSVPASEHSVISMGTKESEIDTFERLITEIYPKGIVSVVSDTFDYWKVITEYLPKLKDKILARSGGFPVDKVVIRPDSGNPEDIICGTGMRLDIYPDAMDARMAFESKFEHMYFYDLEFRWFRYFKVVGHQPLKDKVTFEEFTPGFETAVKIRGSIQLLWEIFGGEENDQGYRQLDSHIGLIYGDSITLSLAEEILEKLMINGFCSTNVVLGIGSYTYEYCTRDTLGYAMKATAGIVNGEFREIFKSPKTDNGMKKSAKGYLAVYKENGEYILKDCASRHEMENSELKEVFRDGKLLVDLTLSEIRELTNK